MFKNEESSPKDIGFRKVVVVKVQVELARVSVTMVEKLLF